MPTAVQDNKTDHSEQMWKVLKAHIVRERARKKQEREAEVEEERLRKEREAREQQDVMTLGETREQISNLETKLQQLKEEKHQLFLQLKKVLNEDDNRRRQLLKENSEILSLQALPTSMVHPQLYISPAAPPRSTTISQPAATFKPSVKRPRSPSPQPGVPVSFYHQSFSCKPTSLVSSSLQNSPQKVSQYTSQAGGFYRCPPQDLVYYPFPQLSHDSRTVFEAPRPTYHLDQKITEHASLRAPSSHGTHVIHSGSMPMNTNSQPPKQSVSGGYPIRNQTQYQQPPTSNLYSPQNALYRHI